MQYWALIFFVGAGVAAIFVTQSATNSVAGISLFFVFVCLAALACILWREHKNTDPIGEPKIGKKQLFSPSTNACLRLTLAGAPILALLFLGIGLQAYSSHYYTQVNTIRAQPVPFSHRHHVGELGIDCRYCHTTVETSAEAGLPSASTCMHCHSQMWATASLLEPVRRAYETASGLAWQRVHRLPDYVYFNHQIHIAKGVGCVTCHGRVDEMPLMKRAHGLQMLWCLNCHREPEKYVRPRAEVFNLRWEPSAPQNVVGERLVREYQIQSKTDCDTCHR